MLEKTHETSGGTVHYRIDASDVADAPWLVFLPGLTADHTLFADQLARFSGTANCFV